MKNSSSRAFIWKLGLTEENQRRRRVGAVLAFLRDEAADLRR
jgi:hypothetical protein